MSRLLSASGHPEGAVEPHCELETISWPALSAFMVIAPVATAIYLGRRLRPGARAAASP